MFRLENDEELTEIKLSEFIQQHKKEVSKRYDKLQSAYLTNYPIFSEKPKPEYKPDNRIAVNFAKYITDTMNGFFIGNPIKVLSDDEKVSAYVEFLDQYNSQDDNNAELSKLCSIFGKAYEMYYIDEVGNVGITYLSPMEAFMVYDDSILERPIAFVRLYEAKDGKKYGSLSNETEVRYFDCTAGVRFYDERKSHGFDGVPATEFRENEEEIGIFEPVLSMINAYNKAISEKANDVDYFADAYLKVLGAKLEEAGLQAIRANRIINFEGNYDGKLLVEFMQKPDGDVTQEHLIDRLERLIFQISMVANISDENFGNSSGISLKYKLQSMSNLAKTKERKFTAGMQNRYRLIFSNPVNKMSKDDWTKLNYQFTFNYPANLLEESQIAGNLAGITSQETQLKVLSIVDNVQAEIDRIESGIDPVGFATDYPTNRNAGAGDL